MVSAIFIAPPESSYKRMDLLPMSKIATVTFPGLHAFAVAEIQRSRISRQYSPSERKWTAQSKRKSPPPRPADLAETTRNGFWPGCRAVFRSSSSRDGFACPLSGCLIMLLLLLVEQPQLSFGAKKPGHFGRSEEPAVPVCTPQDIGTLKSTWT
jgi:hypothetical protein